MQLCNLFKDYKKAQSLLRLDVTNDDDPSYEMYYSNYRHLNPFMHETSVHVVFFGFCLDLSIIPFFFFCAHAWTSKEVAVYRIMRSAPLVANEQLWHQNMHTQEMTFKIV